ncbi:MAG: hypothetical protein Q8M94_15150 [Ignavibacteria bacterium]|nr:hypothetical protein [Ignavibacteria bacterium]
MNKFISVIGFIFIILLFIFQGAALSQDLNVVVHRTYIDSTLGSEMVFDFDVINISQFQQTVFEVRTLNSLPPNWQSSLCFGVNCFSPSLDSVATTPPFGDPLEPGDTLITSLHVYSLTNNGTAHIQIQVGTFRNPTDRITLDFTATTIPVSVEDETVEVKDYYLEQNYPNPFNPTTKIKYSIPAVGTLRATSVQLKVYDMLGNEIATLVDEYKPAGIYEVDFCVAQSAEGGSSPTITSGVSSKGGYTSGVYFYQLKVGEFIQTKKMLLIK